MSKKLYPKIFEQILEDSYGFVEYHKTLLEISLDQILVFTDEIV